MENCLQVRLENEMKNDVIAEHIRLVLARSVCPLAAFVDAIWHWEMVKGGPGGGVIDTVGRRSMVELAKNRRRAVNFPPTWRSWEGK